MTKEDAIREFHKHLRLLSGEARLLDAGQVVAGDDRRQLMLTCRAIEHLRGDLSDHAEQIKARLEAAGYEVRTEIHLETITRWLAKDGVELAARRSAR